MPPAITQTTEQPTDFGARVETLGARFLGGALYPEMPLNPNTQVGTTHANRISINNQVIGIAAQFPKNDQLPEFLESLFDEGSILVVLASNGDVESEKIKALRFDSGDPKISAYFRPESEQTYGTYKVSPAPSSQERRVGEYNAEIYTLRITSMPNHTPRDIPVLHISDWADKSIPQKSETLLSLIEVMHELENKNQDSQSTSGANQKSPVLHCLAGKGRTGIAIAANIMQANPGMTLKDIVPKMRECRPEMLESEEKNFPNETIALFEKFAELSERQTSPSQN